MLKRRQSFDFAVAFCAGNRFYCNFANRYRYNRIDHEVHDQSSCTSGPLKWPITKLSYHVLLSYIISMMHWNTTKESCSVQCSLGIFPSDWNPIIRVYCTAVQWPRLFYSSDYSSTISMHCLIPFRNLTDAIVRVVARDLSKLVIGLLRNAREIMTKQFSLFVSRHLEPPLKGFSRHCTVSCVVWTVVSHRVPNL